MLRVFIPALQVGPRMTGIGTYTLELIRGMSRLPRREEILVGAPHPERFAWLEGAEGFRIVPVPLLRDSAWGRMLATHTVVPRLAQEHRAHFVLGPNFIAPLWGRFDRAVVVHDLTFRRFPETTPRTKRLYYRLSVRWTLQRARRVFVDTQAVARELASWVPAIESKLRLAPLGVAPSFLENGETGDRTSRARERRRAFLFVGTLEPRKNLARLLEAHGRLCRARPDAPTLRLAGGKGWRDEGIERALAAHPDPKRVVRLGYLDDDGLKREYDNALALVFPSMYEGFGLPVLEAMARGCPVITSRGIATEEVAGGAALLVDPHSTEEIERGLARLADEADLVSELARRGRERVRRFSWDACAHLTLQGLHELRPGEGGGEAAGEGR